MALKLEIASILLYLLFAWYVAIYLKVSVLAAWNAEFVYFVVMGSLSYLYLKYGKWNAVKV